MPYGVSLRPAGRGGVTVTAGAGKKRALGTNRPLNVGAVKKRMLALGTNDIGGGVPARPGERVRERGENR